MTHVAQPSLTGQQLAMKRVFDVVGASIGLAVLAPLMGIVAFLIQLESPGPVIFGQERLGRGGRVFRCLKFRSMRADAEAVLLHNPELYREYAANGFKLAAERDERITAFGRFIRRTSLDELPQLWNVLRGDMSLVGPRPIVPQEVSNYREAAEVFLFLRPGLTGAWAVNGRSHVGYPDRAAIELEYVRTWSLSRDIDILLKTLPAVIARRGAY